MSAGALPLAGDYPLDGESRVGGVGEYTMRAASGQCITNDFAVLPTMSWEEMERLECELCQSED